PTAVAIEWKNVGERGSADSWNRSHAGEHIFVVRIHAWLIGEARSRIDSERGGSRRPIPEVDIEDVDEAANQQPSADQQHAGKRDFRDDECTANARVSAAPSGATVVILERVVDGRRSLDCRKKSNEQTGNDGDEHRETKCRRVDPDAVQQRNVERMQLRHEPCASDRKPEPQNRAAKRKYEAFRQRLPNQPSTSSAE